MARIRTIKPSFFTSLTIASLTLTQRLTFIGLWTHVDDDGRCIYDPRLIKAALWPLDDRTADDVADDVRALIEASLITHYTVGERSYLHVRTWSEHQRINRKTPSTLPDPETGEIAPLTCGDEDSVNTHGALTEDVHRERKGKEGKGGEGASATSGRKRPKTPLPENWTPNDKHRELAQARGLDVDYLAERMTNWAHANDARYVDWDATFRNWITSEKNSSARPQVARRASDDWMQST